MKRIALILVLLALGLSGCEGVNPIIDTTVNEESVTGNIGETVILTQYIAFDQKIHDMVDILGTFEAERTQQNLDSARRSWLDAHAAWVRTEAFIFGPAAKEDAEKNLDHFPVSPEDIKIKLATIFAFTPEKIQGFDGTLKGFHLIEYLLWDSTGAKQPSDFTDKQISYMRFVAGDIWRQSQNLYLEWDPNRGNYLDQIRKAGTSESEFASHKDVLKTMLNSMAETCRDLADRKLGGPLAYGAQLEESHYCGNTASDYHNALIGVRNVYLGGEEEAGLSIASLIQGSNNFVLDTNIRNEFQDAMNKILALHPFASTLAMNRNAVIEAQKAVRKLQVSLSEAIVVLGL